MWTWTAASAPLTNIFDFDRVDGLRGQGRRRVEGRRHLHRQPLRVLHYHFYH